MKFVRFGPPGREKPGVVDSSGAVRDLSEHLIDFGPGDVTFDRLKSLGSINPESLPVVANHTRLGPVLSSVGKFIAIGLNYSDHAAESNMPIPTEPVVFMKANSCLSGPNDPIMLPKDSVKTD